MTVGLYFHGAVWIIMAGGRHCNGGLENIIVT